MYTYVVIDDESLIRKGIIKKLSHIRETVCCIGEAENGKDALQIIETLNPDIIITDMKMPLMDGTAFLPILMQKFPSKKIIVISGYKDFQYMKHAIAAQAVDYILKPFSRDVLIDAVMNAVHQLEDKLSIQNHILTSDEEKEQANYKYDIQMLKNLIMGYHTADFSINSERLKIINKNHNLFLITIYSSRALDSFSISNFLTDNSFGDLALFLEHMTVPNLGFLIMFQPEHTALNSRDICIQIYEYFQNLFYDQKTPVLLGCSNIHSSLLELNEAFIETVNALNSKFISDSSTLFFPSRRKKETITITWDKTEEFLFRIEAGMIQQVIELLDELFDYFTTIPNCTLYDIKVFCFSLADQAKAMLNTYLGQINMTSGASKSMKNILNSMFSLHEIKSYYLQFYQNIASLMKDNNIYTTDDVIDKMKQYIQRHYQNNLTIEFLSSLFYLNRTYCSHLFRQRTGETFVHYLNGIRLIKAKELLISTDKKMYQIAKEVGYDNVKYFFRVFKRHENITPEQYRIQYKKKTDVTFT